MRQCPLCGKKPSWVTQYRKVYSKYDPLPKRRQYPNLQWVRLPNGKRIKACAKCIRTLSKTKR